MKADDMEEPSLDSIKQESRQYSRMGELLKKERPPEAAEMVRQVLESRVALSEKIRKIELIDAQEVGNEIAHTVVSDREAQEIIRKHHITTAEAAEKNIPKIRQKPFKNPFFIFLFRDYKKIKDFGQYTDTVLVQLFPPAVKLNYLIYEVNLPIISRDAAELVPQIDAVLEKGWQFLQKLEYNLLVEFRLLCQLLNSLKTISVDSYRKLLPGLLADIEARFLVLHYETEYPDIIMQALSLGMEKIRRPIAQIELSEMQARRLLFADHKGCLSHLITGLAVQETRRVVQLGELVRRLPNGVVNTFDFNCPPQVRQKIQVYLNEAATEWQNILYEKGEIHKIRFFMNFFTRELADGTRAYQFNTLGEFYDMAGKPEGLRFMRDKDDIARFANQFTRVYIREFEDLLIDRVTVEGVGPVRPFGPDIFQLELDKLKRNWERFDQGAFSYPVLSRKDYYELMKVKKEHPALPEELSLFQAIDKISEGLFELGRRLGHIYLRHADKPDAGPELLEPLDIGRYRAQTITIPYWKATVESMGRMRGKPFSEVVLAGAQLAFMACVYLFDGRVSANLERERKITETLNALRRNLERISDPVTFEKIQRLTD